MKTCILSTIVAMAAAANNQATTVLSLDAQNTLGIIQMHMVDKLETMSYDYARQSKCIPERENERMAMPELFDKIAGTQSGAIGAAMLSLKNDDGSYKYYASDVSELFTTHGNAIFSVTPMGGFAKFVWFVFGILLFSALGFGLGYYMHAKNFQQEQLDKVEEFLRITYEREDGDQNGKQGVKDSIMEAIKVQVEDNNQQDLKKVYDAMQAQQELDNQTNLKDLKDAVKDVQRKNENNHSIIMIYSFFGAIIGFFFMFEAGIPLLSQAYGQTKNPADVRAILNQYIPAETKFSDLDTDVMIPAFEFQVQVPRAFFQGSADLAGSNGPETVTLLDAVTAGVADPFTSKPYELDGQILISGLVHAANPTYQALRWIEDFISPGVDAAKDLRMVAIGFDYTMQPDLLPDSVKDWLTDLKDLIYLMKANSQLWLVEQIYRNHPENFVPLQIKFGDIAFNKQAGYKTETKEELIRRTDEAAEEYNEYVTKFIHSLVDREVTSQCPRA